MKVFQRLFPYILSLTKILCKHHRIIQIDIRHHVVLCICYIWLQRKHIFRLSIYKKILWFYLFQKKYIIIEIHKMFRQSRDSMKIQFDGMRVKSRKILLGNILIVIDNNKLRITRIQPLWQMSAGHKINFMNPWCILLYTSKPVL